MLWIAFSLYLVLPILAQDFRASLTGLITDPVGAAVPDARVRVRNLATNAQAETTSNETGRYSIPFLIPGRYTVEVEATGFKKFVRENVELQISVRAALDITLELGSLNEQVTVTSQVSQLETETASRGGIVDNDLLLNVPNAGRNVYQLAFAMPGVYKPSTSQGTAFNLDGLANSRTSINGAAAGPSGTESNVDVLIDGTSDTKGDRQVVMIPALESVQEFRVLTNIFDAQYGRTGGGIITTTTKSGTNEFHGTVFDRYYDDRLNANSWSNNRRGVSRPTNVQHNYGFLSTGPIWIPKIFDGRNKFFYMVSYDSSPSASLYTSQFTTPLPEMKQGDFTNLFANDGRRVIIYDPATTRLGPDGRTYLRDPFAGNRIPANRINPVGARIVSYYPDPTVQGDTPARLNNFFQTSNNTGELWQWTGRLDIRPTNRNAFFGRYGETNMTRCCDRRYPENNPAEVSTILPRGRRGRTLTIDWTSIVNPSTTLNLRVGFARLENLAWNPQSLAFHPRDLGLPAALVSQFSRLQYPLINMGAYMSQGSTPFVQADDTYSAGAQGGKVVATHVMKFGVDLRDFRANNLSFGASSGNFTFSRLWTQADPNRGDAYSGNEIATALLGHPVAGFADIPITTAYRGKYYALFFQDDWKLTRRLTLNLGLRWDYETPVFERYNRQTRGFAFGQPSPIADQVRNRPGLENCPACRNLTGGLLFAGSKGDARYAFAPDRNNFQPRIGVAFSLDRKTVLRGGYGIYSLGQWALGPNTGFSRSTPVIATVDGVTPSASMSNPFPNGLLQPVGSSLGLATDLGLGIAFHYTNRPLPISQQVSAGFQREMWWGILADVSYVGNYTSKLPVSGQLNSIPISELGRPAAYYNERVTNPFAGLLPNNSALNGATIQRSLLMVAYPQYSSVIVSHVPAGRTRYDAMQMSIKRRFTFGLNFQFNYMVTKNLERYTLLNAQDLDASDILNPRLEKRLAIFDVPQKASFLGTYDLPVGRKRAFLNRLPPLAEGLLGGWKLGWNWTFQSGFPIDFPNAAPLEARSAKLPKNQRTLERWFDTSLFPRVAGPVPFTLRNFPSRFPDVRYMGFRNYDFSLMKDIRVFTERVTAQVRADVINTFNSPYFTQLVGNPPNVTSANFGQINPQQNNQPRVIYLEFRMRF
ncbi:MAG: carboxypeptidase regulatory-like domain-containing protein [Bryobacteraceae bacterium]|nr:carboxypeptidase regulatory-like domain-containing protein [Bryobacteraceae bacterium]MDW8376617.1 carboxypeptidase regulatory-like domain-containing protein [Bryobacterales bacterium]